MKTLAQVVMVVGVVALSSCSAQIQHGLDERDANELISVLTGRGFEARKVPEKGKKPTWAVEVDEERATDALRVLTELKLPRPRRTTTQDVAAQSGLIETPAAEKLRQLEAQEGDIELALETMDGVTSAAVELVVPTAPRPGQPPVPSKASVLLRVTADNVERLEQQRAGLRALVAAAVDGLRADDVVLVIDPVASQVPVAAPKAEERGLRTLVVALGAASSLLALALAVMGTLLRRRKAPAALPAPKTTPAPQPAVPVHTPKPIVSPAVTRKVA